jgi:hypothetical protein
VALGHDAALCAGGTSRFHSAVGTGISVRGKEKQIVLLMTPHTDE